MRIIYAIAAIACALLAIVPGLEALARVILFVMAAVFVASVILNPKVELNP